MIREKVARNADFRSRNHQHRQIEICAPIYPSHN